MSTYKIVETPLDSNSLLAAYCIEAIEFIIQWANAQTQLN